MKNQDVSGIEIVKKADGSYNVEQDGFVMVANVDEAEMMKAVQTLLNIHSSRKTS